MNANQVVPDVCRYENDYVREDNTGLFGCCNVRVRCCCFYLVYVVTCILVATIIHSVVLSYTSILLKIEELTEEINALRNELLDSQQEYDSTPSEPPSLIDSQVSNDLLKVIENALAKDNYKILDDLIEIRTQFQLILDLLNAMLKDLSKQISQSPREVVTYRALAKISTDPFDYAAESAGGEIYSTDDTKLLKVYYFGSIYGWIENTPRMIIQPSIYPGECFGFAGKKGSVVIKLASRIFIDSVTIGHIPKELSPSGDINTAPRDITVSGLSTPDDGQSTKLATFAYDTNKHQVFQTFPVKTNVGSCQYVRFNFTSNHGNLDKTCVYRVRVHGKLDER